MKKHFVALALAAAPFLAHASQSNGIGYTYGQLDVVYQDAGSAEDTSAYPTGFNLSGSYAFTGNVFATAAYGRTEEARYQVRYKNPNWSLGVGMNTAIGKNADWVTQLHYVDSDAYARLDSGRWHCTDCRVDLDRRGATVETGVLGRVVDGLTANAYLGYEDYNHEAEGNFFADFGAVYAFDRTWGLHAGLKLSEGVDTYTVGVRASF